MKFQQPGTVVAELWCQDFHKSLTFYTEILGFSIGQHKEGSTHAYLMMGSSQIMISNYDHRGTWETGPFENPLGRGINFSFFVDDVQSVYNMHILKNINPSLICSPSGIGVLTEWQSTKNLRFSIQMDTCYVFLNV